MSDSVQTPWTVARQAPPGMEPTSLTSSALVGSFFTTSATWDAHTQGNVMVVNFFYSRILVVQESEYIPVAIYRGKFL